MMPALTAPWRLAVHNDARTVLGTGFLVAPRLALTCAHVVAKNRSGDLWVQCGGPRAVPARVHPTGLTVTQRAGVVKQHAGVVKQQGCDAARFVIGFSLLP